jgi:methionine biosynthesis protein MetW
MTAEETHSRLGEDAESRPLTFREIVKAAWPDPDDLFPDLVSDYEEYHAHVDTGRMTRAKLIAPWIARGSRVLDAGCGDGFMAEFLARERDAHVEGFDVAEAAVKKTQARGIPATVKDLDEEPALPSGFDYILFVEVLEHLRRPHIALKEASAKARLATIVTIPNSGWFGYRLQVTLGHAPRQSFTHLHFWSHKDFIAFCRRLKVPRPEARFLTSGRSVRGALVMRWPNLFAHQLAYRIPSTHDP